MKRSGLTPRFLAATLFLVTLMGLRVSAQEMAGTPAAKAAKRAEELLRRFDKNNDGKLDDDERAEAKEAMMKEQIERQMARAAAFPGGLEQFRAVTLELFDKNKDGRLDDDERAAAQKFGEEHAGAPAAMDELIKHFDKNGNGRIDPEERAQMDTFLGGLRSLGTAQIRNQLLRRFDLNANGKIDDSEMPELEKFVRPRVENNSTQLRRYDKNGDGKLDDAEWAAARSALTQWLNTDGPAALDADITKDEVRRNPEQEQARLKAVAEEVARRRAVRETETAGAK